ncbi:HNH endonuclease [Tomitella biformata]|uniref:HNH endonuclease n=1 Tax=Tomitella biformata TaxID=630403 RepID=UPI000467361E|nr:HNH endonuclease [Tomitella biformata]
MAQPDIAEFVDPSPAMLSTQWKSVLDRNVLPGQRQVDFVPCEIVLCLCASLVLNHRDFSSENRAKTAGRPIPEFHSLFQRRRRSFFAKMANLDGSLPNAGMRDIEVAARLLSDSLMLQDVYLRIMRSARLHGIDEIVLPDFLGLEGGESLVLSGQEELVLSDVEFSLEGALQKWRDHPKGKDIPAEMTERLLIGAVRVGQHRFAEDVLTNHGRRCVFCGLSGSIGGRERPRLLTASHIKPWKDSDNKERLDHRNGFTACPTHDVAFDTGLITVDEDLGLHYAPGVEAEFEHERPLRLALGRPPLGDRLILPDRAARPDVACLNWHRDKVFVAI